jgi:hypothetical protein
MKLKFTIIVIFILIIASFNAAGLSSEEPEPNVDCNGSLYFMDIEAGSTQFGSFTIKNTGEAGSKLNWRISSYPDWGSFSFSRSAGSDLGSGEEVTIDVEIAVPNVDGAYYSGEIKVRDRECSCHWDTVSVVVETIDPADFHSQLSVSDANFNFGEHPPRTVKTEEITIKNTGEPNSILGWAISIPQEDKSWIKVTNIQGGQYLEKDAEATVEFSIYASHEYEILRQGSITIQNKADSSQDATFSVQIKTEKENIRYKFLNIFSLFLEKFKFLNFYTKNLYIL